MDFPRWILPGGEGHRLAKRFNRLVARLSFRPSDSPPEVPGVAAGPGRSAAAMEFAAVPSDGALPRDVVARVAAVLFIACGLLTFTSPLLPGPEGANLIGVAATGGVAAVFGVCAWFLPWNRWPRTATLCLLLVGLLLIALHNYFRIGDAYRFGVLFTVAFMWLGMAHPRGTVVFLLGPFVVAYVSPLWLTGTYSPDVIGSLIYTGAVCITVSETFAWVTERLRRARLTISRNEHRFRRLVTNASDIITVIDEDGRITYDSPAIHRVLGYLPGSRDGSLAVDAIHPEDVADVMSVYDRVMSHPDDIGSVDARVRHQDGTWRWMELSISNVIDDPALRGVVVNYHDITERKMLQEDALQYQARHDALTALANRALFLPEITRVLARPRSSGSPSALIFLDLDNFKAINDTFGHETGDHLLVEVALRIRQTVRQADVAARLGGDEFAVLLHEVHNIEEAQQIAERLLERLKLPFVIDHRVIFVDGSIGLAFPQPGATAESLLRSADLALYSAKRSGKGQVQTFHHHMQDEHLRRLQLSVDLRKAVEHDELTLAYQPIVELGSGRIVGLEALARWEHPEHGPIAPSEFIPIAEETGTIAAIGRWVVQHACMQLDGWRQQYSELAHLFLSVNVSGMQLQRPELIEDLKLTIEASPWPETQLVLEITEGAMMHDGSGATARQLRALKNCGVRLAIDDFGTGYSSLSRLNEFPIDILKIDRSFVNKLVEGPSAVALMHAILALSAHMGIKALAEGIETKAQHDVLQALGCNVGQGYLLAKPVAQEAMNAFLYDLAQRGFAIEQPTRTAVAAYAD